MEQLFKRFEKAPESEKPGLSRQICDELSVHAQIEERLFYPEIKSLGEEIKSTVLEGVEEHREIKEVIRELKGTAATDEHFEPRMKVLKEDVEHHVQEEESELFPEVKRAMGAERLKSLGLELEELKMRLKGGEERISEFVQEPGAIRA